MANKATYKLRKNRAVRLPIQVIEKVLDLKENKIIKSDATLDNVWYILYALTSGYRKEGYENYNLYRPFPVARLKKMIGDNAYKMPLKILLDNSIIQREGEAYPSFTTPRGEIVPSKCYLTRINPDLLKSLGSKNIEFSYVERIHSHKEFLKQQNYAKQFKKSFDTLEIPFMKLYRAIDEHLIKLENDGVCDVKIRYIEDSYREAVYRLQIGETNAIRKIRLYSNFTNLPNLLFKIIKEHNGLFESDVKSSQPALIAHLMEQNKVVAEDVIEFQKAVYEDDIYMKFTRGGLSRDEAKRRIFRIAFSKPESYPREKREFAELFPNVLAFIDSYKTKGDHGAFARLMQAMESKIFIDGIYETLFKMNITFFTKHDSVIYFEKDAEVVQKVIQEHFDKIGFKGQLKHEIVLERALKVMY